MSHTLGSGVATGLRAGEEIKGQPGHLAVYLMASTTGYGLNTTLLKWRWTGHKATLLEFACGAEDVGDPGSIPESERYPGGGNGNPQQYSFLENPLDRGAWQATVYGVAKSWT